MTAVYFIRPRREIKQLFKDYFKKAVLGFLLKTALIFYSDFKLRMVHCFLSLGA